MPFEGEQQFLKPETKAETNIRETDQKLRQKVDSLMSLFCNEFIVDGKENVIKAQKEDPDAKFVIASSHISNLDAPAAIKALGDRFDMQITAESVLFGLTPQEIMFRLGGKDHFTPIKYRKERKAERGKYGVFNPNDFKAISGKMDEGRTPWIAIHPFNEKKEMGPSRIGAVYLANKTGAKIIPAALEFEGGSVSLEGAKELIKGLESKIKGEAKATYHVGQAIDLPKVDVKIIESVLEKRSRKEKVTREEMREFSKAHRLLKEQANYVAEIISSMLPEEQRGVFRNRKQKRIAAD